MVPATWKFCSLRLALGKSSRPYLKDKLKQKVLEEELK
jgi:hypothetical protein